MHACLDCVRALAPACKGAGTAWRLTVWNPAPALRPCPACSKQGGTFMRSLCAALLKRHASGGIVPRGARELPVGGVGVAGAPARTSGGRLEHLFPEACPVQQAASSCAAYRVFTIAPRPRCSCRR